jgi:hypothetical protein
MTSSGSVERSVLSVDALGDLYTPRIEVQGLFGLVADWYAYGHFVESLSGGRVAVWHGGQGHGWMTHFHSIPELGEGIVILTNSQRSWPFIGEVLRDWCRWTGAGMVKMTRLAHATPAIRVLVTLLFGVTFWLLYSVVRGLISGQRRSILSFAPRRCRWLCVVRATIGLGLIGLVIWRASLPYVFESSIFPSDIVAVAVALVALGVVLVLSSAAPKVRNATKGG